MKRRLLIFGKYYLFWIFFFLLQKPLFMLINLPRMGAMGWEDWFLVPLHAFPLDLSVASYVMLLFGLLLALTCLVVLPSAAQLLNIYTGILLAVGLLTFIGDCGVFPAWGFHLDKTIFIYLSSPREVLACAEWWVWILGLAAWILGWWLCFRAYRWWMGNWSDYLPIKKDWRKRVLCSLAFVLLTALLFLPIRGSVTTSTMNTGRVYFSKNQMLNLAAINPLFNIMESLGENTFDTQKYTYLPSDEAHSLVADLLPAKSRTSVGLQYAFDNRRPNIVLFILESFSANAWKAMPNLRRLADEGVDFTAAVASSFRTDRGVVAVLSGFPGQPTSSLMTVPYKSKGLPQLGKNLAAVGYQLKFWSGGDEDFTNMRSYLISGGFQDRVCDHSFPVGDRLSKWGVPDHILFNRAAREIRERETLSPTLDVILSLSSHEPFEVPATHRFDNLYLNSVAYTDSCIGAFADSLRLSPQWDNTLLVFVADHGYAYPPHLQNFEPDRYHIPMVFAGGVVKEPMKVNRVCSQIDLVPTLLAQLDLEDAGYEFGKNALDTTAAPFAFYSFSDGFALITATDTVVVDAKSDQRLIGDNEQTERQARAFVQTIMETIDEL